MTARVAGLAHSFTLDSLRRGAVALMAFALPAFATAADWTFDPSVSLAATTADNVQVSSAGEKLSDTWLRAEVTLALRGQTPRSKFSLSYTPTHELYDEFGELDNTSHALQVGWDQETSARTSWDFALRGSQREAPRLAAQDAELDLVAVPRDKVFDLGGSLGGNVKVGALSSVFFSSSWSSVRYDNDVLRGEDLDPDGTGDIAPLDVADSSTLGLQAGWERRLARDQAVRVFWSGSRIDEGFRGESDVHRLLGSWSYGSLERLQFTVQGGVARTDPRGVATSPGSDDSASAVVGGLGVSGRTGRRGSFALGYDHDVSGTRGTGGIVEADSLFGSLVQPTGRYSSFEIFARWSDRSAVEGLASTGGSSTTSYGANWSAALGPHWSLVFSGERIDQSAGDAADPRNADYTSFSGGVRWTPTRPRG